MSSDLITLIWLAAGIALAVIELFLPGLVVIFLGIAAMLVAALRFLGVLEELLPSLAVWMALSVVLVLTTRKAARRWFPGEARRDASNEQSDAYGQVVEVIEDCGPDSPTGRIRFQGTSWPAMTLEGTIAKGQRCRLVFRDNIAWMVEPVGSGEDPRAIEEALERELLAGRPSGEPRR